MAPLYWTKLLRPVIAQCRALGVRCLLYLDDLIVLGGSKCTAAVNWAIVAGSMAKKLKLLFNADRTPGVPAQIFDALGFEWRTQNQPTVRLPTHKRKHIRRMAKRLVATADRSKDNTVPSIDLGRLIGTIEAAKMAVPWIKRYKGTANWCLQRGLRRKRGGGWNGRSEMRKQVRSDLPANQSPRPGRRLRRALIVAVASMHMPAARSSWTPPA